MRHCADTFVERTQFDDTLRVGPVYWTSFANTKMCMHTFRTVQHILFIINCFCASECYWRHSFILGDNAHWGAWRTRRQLRLLPYCLTSSSPSGQKQFRSDPASLAGAFVLHLYWCNRKYRASYLGLVNTMQYTYNFVENLSHTVSYSTKLHHRIACAQRNSSRARL